MKLSCSENLILLDSLQNDWWEDDVVDEDAISGIQNGWHQAECLKLM